MWTDRRRRPRLIKLELIIIYLLVCIISYMHNPTLLACIIILNEDNAHLVSALALFAPRGAAAWRSDEASAAWSRDEVVSHPFPCKYLSRYEPHSALNFIVPVGCRRVGTISS